MHISEI
jgi:hypothetical protein